MSHESEDHPTNVVEALAPFVDSITRRFQDANVPLELRPRVLRDLRPFVPAYLSNALETLIADADVFSNLAARGIGAAHFDDSTRELQNRADAAQIPFSKWAANVIDDAQAHVDLDKIIRARPKVPEPAHPYRVNEWRKEHRDFLRACAIASDLNDRANEDPMNAQVVGDRDASYRHAYQLGPPLAPPDLSATIDQLLAETQVFPSSQPDKDRFFELNWRFWGWVLDWNRDNRAWIEQDRPNWAES